MINGARTWTNNLVCVDVILEMMLQRSDECAFRTCYQSFGRKMFVFMAFVGFRL